VCADVGLRWLEVELVRASACHSDEARARPSDDARAGKRHIFDDPGVGTSHAPSIEADKVLEDFLF
jgi:hypothetical protein